jgi:predicted Ser/Thr protein kinase
MTKCLQCGVENAQGNAFCENCGKPVVAPGAGGATMQTLGDLNTIGGEQTLHRDAFPKSGTDTLEPGTVFAERYTIQSLIGIGGMGVVYRARDRIGDRDVALKLIRTDRLGGEGAVSRLISEGVTTQDIRHRNVVGVYHVDQSAGRPFLSMEFVNGVSLREWHRKQVNARADVPMKVAARIVREILDGLQAAHEMGVVHRDLKPENIMLTGEPGETAAPLKILDFGIARAMGKPVESGTGTGLGTPRYMAPEQITNAESAGPSADLYSLSIIFYELLVDVLPTGGWQPPSSGRSDVPAAIDALIQSGMQNRPASRPQSVADYRGRLDAAMGGGGPAPDDSGGGRPQPLVDDVRPAPDKGRNWLKIGGGVLAGLFALGVVGQLIEDGPGPTPARPGAARSAAARSAAATAGRPRLRAARRHLGRRRQRQL